MTSIASIHAYLDTSILGGYFDVEFAEAPRRLFRAFADGRLMPYLGQQTLDELAGAPAEVVDLVPLIPGDPEILPVDDEVMALADAYLRARALPSGSVGDADHD